MDKKKEMTRGAGAANTEAAGNAAAAGNTEAAGNAAAAGNTETTRNAAVAGNTEATSKDIVKRRLLVLLRLLYEETDEDHPLDTFQLLEYLAEHDVPANRKTLKSDIDLLIEAGLDIVTVRSRPNKYFWGDRAFEMPELKLLIDAVSSSRFVTQKKSTQLGKKLMGLASEHQRKELHRHIYATNRVKSSNEAIFYTVDTINRAITKRKKIAFRYNEYDINKKKTFRNNGEVYELSPYALFWNEDFYYVVGWSEKHGNVSVFRVDRMERPDILDGRAVKRPEGFSLSKYSKQIFEMYEGDEVEVRLECVAEQMKYVIDRFGEDVKTERIPLDPDAAGVDLDGAAGKGDADAKGSGSSAKAAARGATDGWLDPDRFIATVNVSLSPTFYAWVFQFGGDIKIISPAKAVDEMTEMEHRVMEGY